MSEPVPRAPAAPTPGPRPLRGWRLLAALTWVAGVVLLYLVVRELGVRVVP